MNIHKILIAFITLVCYSTIISAPSVKLLSGDKGVLLAITNVKEEPKVKVELVDSDLDIAITSDEVNEESHSTVVFDTNFWADSATIDSKKGSIDIKLYNFSLSIEDMQKKFTPKGFLLFVTPNKAVKYTKTLWGYDGSLPTINNVEIVNRDGLEFVKLVGLNLSSATIAINKGGVTLDLHNEVFSRVLPLKLSKELLVKSIKSSNNTLDIAIDTTRGVFNFMTVSDSLLKLVFTDNREKSQNKILIYDGTKTSSLLINDVVNEGTKRTKSESKEVEKSNSTKSEVDQSSSNTKTDETTTTVLYLIKDKVNLRSTPKTGSSNNVLGQYPLGTRMVLKTKKNSWYNVIVDDTLNAWVYHSLAEDSTKITSEKWDEIYNKRESETAEKPIIDEFSSTSSDPLIDNSKDNVFSLDSNEVVKDSTKTIANPKVAEKVEDEHIKPYKKYGRDPFLPLNKTSDFLKPKLPDVDNMKLVGIMYDPADGIALFEEDVNGESVSFAMKVGEKVKNGKLLHIYENRVVFLMWEADVTYTVEKELVVNKE